MRTLLIIIASVVFFSGCRKDDQISSDPAARLEFSTDSILFDTVFTSVGSVTQRIKVFNRGKKALRISDIKLGGGNLSSYQININGVASTRLSGFTLQGNDSMNVFVKVSINPNSASLPFIVKDSIEFLTNGNYQKVILSAFGQNAIFLKDAVLNTNTTWNNKLPYVIYNNLKVSAGASLTIQKGCRVHFHSKSGMIIGGSLKVEGDLADSVIFSSDRLESVYAEEPGQWQGIHFLSSSSDNLINYARIKNAIVGIKVDSLSRNTNPKLLLVNSIVKNMELLGLSLTNAEVTGFNNLIYNCGRHLVYGIGGGIYNFKQNTFTNAGSRFSRSSPSIFFTDQLRSGVFSAFNLTLVNNIVWGNLSDELIIERKGALAFNQMIRKNLISSRDVRLEATDNILNKDPIFRNVKQENFSLQQPSPAANKGENLTGDAYYGTWLSKDFNGRPRVFPSDLGSYEIL